MPSTTRAPGFTFVEPRLRPMHAWLLASIVATLPHWFIDSVSDGRSVAVPGCVQFPQDGP